MENQSENTPQKPSHLRSRWKRKTAPSATIHEDNAQHPKELKTVKIATAEPLNYQGKLVRSNRPNPANNRHSSRPKGSCKHTQSCGCHSNNPSSGCACQTIWYKVKRFACKLFAIPTKAEGSTCAPTSHKNNRHCSNRPHRHPHTFNKHSRSTRE